jgi:hypothetical protein
MTGFVLVYLSGREYDAETHKLSILANFPCFASTPRAKHRFSTSREPSVLAGSGLLNSYKNSQYVHRYAVIPACRIQHDNSELGTLKSLS